MADTKAPLAGIKVIELGTHAAIPSTTRCLADWGAEVIKIEGMKGDEWRVSGRNVVIPVEIDENAVFTFYNANKKMIALDLKSAEGMEVFYKLIEGADVFVSNVRMKSLEKMKLGYEDLKARNPKLVYAHFSGFGDKGPDAEKPGFDKTSFWAKSGALVDWAFVEGPPINPPTAFGDNTVGAMMVSGILAGILGCQRTGEGTFVSSSLYGCAIWFNINGIVCNQKAYINKLNAYPKSVLQPLLPFSHFYQCKDGEWIMITIIDHNTFYPKIMTALGLTQYLEDARYRTIDKAKENIKEFVGILSDQFKTKDCAEWQEIIGAANIVCERLVHFKDVTEDEQAWANDYLAAVKFPSGNTITLPKVPVQFSTYKVDKYQTTGEIGRDTEEVLVDLGYTKEQVAEFRDKAAVK